MQQDIMGGGNSWGNADCILKLAAAPNAVTTTTTTPAATSPVGEWNIGSFGPCSVTCGEGVQTRTVFCSTGSASDCPGAVPSTTQSCNEQECPTTPNLKVAVKEAFDVIKLTTTTIEGESFQRKFALPALIRKAFHDAGHFDHEIGEVRLGCIQHFLGNTMCPQHAHFEKAEDFRQEVEHKLEEQNVEFSLADIVQLLGALAVDELAQTTGAELLYPKIRIGRTDSTVENCDEDMVEMCNNLPAFAVHTTGQHGNCGSATTCHSQVTNALNAVWESEIEGKMTAVNTLTKVDAVSLIGAHTVGKHAIFGAWVTKPMLFDNDYWIQLRKLKQHLDNNGQFGQDQDHVYSKNIFSDWFQDSTKIDGSPTSALFNEFKGVFSGEIMMLDSDLALILNAPEEVELYAEDLLAWRADFDAAYIKMGELGVTDVLTLPEGSETELSVGASRRTSKRASNADEEAEFFQNLELLRQEQLSRANEIHANARQPIINIEDKPRQSLEAIGVAPTFLIQVFALIGLVSMGYFTVKCCVLKNEYTTISNPEY